MGLGLLFPGQGTQHVGTLPWLETGDPPKRVLAGMAAVLGADWRVRLNDPAWSRRNAVAQPLLTGLCLAAWEALAPLLPAPRVVAGYSVGELAAFSAAGVFTAEVALRLAQQRAERMDACVQGQDTGLLAVTGFTGAAGVMGVTGVTGDTPDAVDALCRQHGLALAIRIGPDRCVLGGPGAALAAAARQAEAAGATGTRLAVAIASHTPWLAGAVPSFAGVLVGEVFDRPQAALVCNHGAGVLRRPDDLRQALAGQIASTLRWDLCMDTVAERGPVCLLEVGPGNTLARMWRVRHPAIPVRSLDDFHSPQAVADWVAKTLDQRR